MLDHARLVVAELPVLEAGQFSVGEARTLDALISYSRVAKLLICIKLMQCCLQIIDLKFI